MDYVYEAVDRGWLGGPRWTGNETARPNLIGSGMDWAAVSDNRGGGAMGSSSELPDMALRWSVLAGERGKVRGLHGEPHQGIAHARGWSEAARGGEAVVMEFGGIVCARRQFVLRRAGSVGGGASRGTSAWGHTTSRWLLCGWHRRNGSGPVRAWGSGSWGKWERGSSGSPFYRPRRGLGRRRGSLTINGFKAIMAIDGDRFRGRLRGLKRG